ncbi:MAG: hypothetical protein JNM07_12220 [Phycisphaerae bacterium]|nr:hypothetical protein [Phycisphaerae bacterium]
MSVADLQLTLLFASGSGMAEGNPLARFIMQRHEPWMLMAWKGLLVGLTCTILLAVRRTRAGEAAAWICCLVLSALSLHWSSFAERMTQVEPVMHEVAESSGERWVRIPDVR